MNENTEHNIEKVESVDNITIEELQNKISMLQTELLATESKAAHNWDLLLRSKAEEDNLRKRSKIDLENAHKYGIEKFARSMVNVVDTLERGIESSVLTDPTLMEINKDGVNIIESLKNGMELTLKLLLDSLEQFGVKMISPNYGDLFNPVQHEALSVQENFELPANSVITVIQKGFVIYDRVLRHARVVVSKRT